jgi:hypothetical protein
MKFCLIAFFFEFGIASLAQTTTPQALPPTTFFTKGQEWEYANFLPKMGLFGKRKGYFEITRFVYKVTGVTDSNGVACSTIIKTGTAANDNYSWHRNFIVHSSQAVLSVPVDYYLMDTVFLCDIYGNWPKPSVYSDLHVTGDSLQYPLDVDTSSQLKSSSYVMDANIYDPQRAEGMSSVGFKGTPRTTHYKGLSATITRRFMGTTRITTQAGTFDCYHIHVEVDMEAGPMRKTILEEYYNPAVGVVKTEDVHGSYMELVRVKKKK